jgi:hypothetical protein
VAIALPFVLALPLAEGAAVALATAGVVLLTALPVEQALHRRRARDGWESGLPATVVLALATLLGTSALAAFALSLRLSLAPAGLDLLLHVAITTGVLFPIPLLLGILLLWKPAADGRVAELRRRIPLRPLGEQLGEALAFERYVAPRVLSIFLTLIGSGLGIALLLTSLPITLLLWVNASVREALAGGDWFPLLTEPLFHLSMGAGVWILGVTLLGLFRATARVRRSGRLAEATFWREIGYALESTALLPSLVWGCANLVICSVLVLIGSTAASLLLAAGWSAWAVIPVVLFWFLFGCWTLLFLPQMYVFCILARRDCGWLRATDVGVRLVGAEGRDAVVRGGLAALLSSTIVGIPGAIVLLSIALDRQEIVLAALLGEKTAKEVEIVLRSTEVQTGTALRKFHDLLDQGRYLDALNGFQMYRFNHPEDPAAIRGEALALLRMGNAKAREMLERWARLAPGDSEAAELLGQLAAGEWGPSGARFLAADQRCTQRIGRGV